LAYDKKYDQTESVGVVVDPTIRGDSKRDDIWSELGMTEDKDIGSGRYRLDIFSQTGRLIGGERVDQLFEAQVLCTHWSELGVSARLWDMEQGILLRAVRAG
jgi:hypothetical protein